MEFLKNISINLKASGPAAVLISWVVGVTLLGILGEGEITSKAMSVLSVTGALLIAVLGHRA